MVAPTIVYPGKALPRALSRNETDYHPKTKNKRKN